MFKIIRTAMNKDSLNILVLDMCSIHGYNLINHPVNTLTYLKISTSKKTIEFVKKSTFDKLKHVLINLSHLKKIFKDSVPKINTKKVVTKVHPKGDLDIKRLSEGRYKSGVILKCTPYQLEELTAELKRSGYEDKSKDSNGVKKGMTIYYNSNQFYRVTDYSLRTNESNNAWIKYEDLIAGTIAPARIPVKEEQTQPIVVEKCKVESIIVPDLEIKINGLKLDLDKTSKEEIYKIILDYNSIS